MNFLRNSPEYYTRARKKGQIKGNISRGQVRRAHKAMTAVMNKMEAERRGKQDPELA
jgi:hypothetical protein